MFNNIIIILRIHIPISVHWILYKRELYKLCSQTIIVNINYYGIIRPEEDTRACTVKFIYGVELSIS